MILGDFAPVWGHLKLENVTLHRVIGEAFSIFQEFLKVVDRFVWVGNL